MEILPSKKFIFYVVIFILIGGFFFTTSQENKSKEALRNSDLALGAIQEYKDSDNDGLSDWEEILFETDPFNPDSNGDGISDGEEYGNKKIYPELSAEEIPLLNNLQELTKPGNITNSLFREAALRYNTASEDPTNTPSLNDFVESLAEDFSIPQQKDFYTLRNIRTTKKNDLETTNQYVSNVITVFGAHDDIYKTDPLALLDSWFTSNDPTILEKLNDVGEEYKELARTIASLNTPSELTEIHLDLVNALHKSSEALFEAVTLRDDPVRSMLATAKYLNLKKERQESIRALGFHLSGALAVREAR